MARFELGDPLTTLTQCKEVETRLSAFNAPPLQQSVAEALLFQAKAQRALGNYEAALSLVDDIVERFGESKRPEVQDRLSEHSSKGAHCPVAAEGMLKPPSQRMTK